METTRTRSAGVTAAAALSIMGCVSALLFWLSFFLPMINYQTPQKEHVYELHPLLFGFIALVPPLLIALGIKTGIGLFQLRSWARKAALIWAAIALFFCLTMIALRPFETFFIPQRFVSDVYLLKQTLAVSFIILLLPFSIWCLFFFRLPGVKAQFEPPNSPGPRKNGG